MINIREKNIKLLMEYLKNSFSEITSLLYVINQKANNTMYDQEVICYYGQDHLMISYIHDTVVKKGFWSFLLGYLI